MLAVILSNTSSAVRPHIYTTHTQRLKQQNGTLETVGNAKPKSQADIETPSIRPSSIIIATRSGPSAIRCASTFITIVATPS